MKIIINGVMVDESTQFEYVANPKKVGSKAHARYEEYQYSESLDQYKEIQMTHDEGRCANPDLKYDHAKGFLTFTDCDGVEL